MFPPVLLAVELRLVQVLRAYLLCGLGLAVALHLPMQGYAALHFLQSQSMLYVTSRTSLPSLPACNSSTAPVKQGQPVHLA